MKTSSGISRRTFLHVSAGAGAGLVLGCTLRASDRPKARSSNGQAFTPNAFVQIDPSGAVTITVSKPDIGQGVRTSLAMIVAEELGVDWSSVKVKQAPADRQTYGGQGVGGSGSVRGMYGPLRMAGAAAALMLRTAAAQKWGVPLDECRVENGVVRRGANGQRLGFGELAEAAAKLPAPEASQIQPKPKSEFLLIGKPTRRVDNRDVVTGKAIFGLDVKPEGLKYAVVARSPSFGARLQSVDDAACKAVPGVRDVFAIGSGVAVVADSTWAALKGRDALKVRWDPGANGTFSSDELRARFKEALQQFPAMPSGAVKIVEATFELPYLSHAPMEPMNCTAHVQGDRCEIWAPTQSPDSARDGVARALNLPIESVTVHVTLVGGGFGRRLATDYVSEAVQISRRVSAPVQLVWTRDDDMRHDNYRPANFHAFRGAVDADGMPLAYFQQSFEAGGGRRQAAWGNARINYRVPNSAAYSGSALSPVPTGAWRSVENTYHCFVTECFFDELCTAGGKDPARVRLELMANGRLKRTLQTALEKAGWGKPLPKGWGRGVACFSGYGSFITQVAEVEVKSSGEVKVHRVVAVVDCGLAINPLGIDAQIQGATVDAVSTTLFSEITIARGGVEQESYAEFGWARMKDAPKVEVHIIAEGDSPGGMGEVGYPAAGPAIANAIFASCGKRVRRLPVRPADLA
jgi:isoquinoline 1-oxidoreductase beta subunit